MEGREQELAVRDPARVDVDHAGEARDRRRLLDELLHRHRQQRLRLFRVRPRALASREEAQVRDLLPADMDLVRARREASRVKPLEDGVHRLRVLLHAALRRHDDVVTIREGHARREPRKRRVDGPHEDRRTRSETHRHAHIAILSPRCAERRLQVAAVLRLQLDLMEAHEQVHDGEQGGPAQRRQVPLNPR